MIKVEIAYSGMNSVELEFAEIEDMWEWWNNDATLLLIKPDYWINKSRVQDLRVAR